MGRWRRLATPCQLTALVVTSSLWFSYADANSDNGDRLAVGTRLEREIADQEVGAYSVALDRDHFLHVRVVQREIDLVVELADARGDPVLLVDGPNGPEGPEDLAFVASQAGEYRLNVRSPPRERGSYEIQVLALRPATAYDRDHATAFHLYLEAEGLRSRQDVESQRRALDSYREVLARLEHVEDPLLDARTLRRIAQVLDDLGDLNQAIDFYERALQRLRGLTNDWELAPVLNNAGNAWRRAGEPGKARQRLEESLEISTVLGNGVGAAGSLNNLGMLYDTLGEPQKALASYDQALAEWRKLGNRVRQASALHNLGTVCVSLGRTEDALDYLQQALDIHRSADDLREQAVTLTSIGWAHSRDGDFRAALDAYDQALPLRRSVGDRQGEAVTLDLRGDALRELRNWDSVLASYQEALDLVRDTGERLNEAHILTNLGLAYEARGEPRKAAETHGRALAIFRQMGDLKGEARALVGLARVDRRNGELASAKARLEEALEIVESVRLRLRSLSFRSTYLATRFDDYGLYIDVLMALHAARPDQGYAALAFEASERARARSLLERLSDADFGPRSSIPPELLEREREIRRSINAKENRRLRLVSVAPEEVAPLEKDLRALLLEYEKLEGRIRSARSRTGGVANSLNLRQIRAELDENTLLLAYALGEDRSFLWVVGTTALESYELPPRSEVEELARRVVKLAPRSHERGLRLQSAAAMTALSNRILAPAASVLGDNRLVILGDGVLQAVPFGAMSVLPGGMPLLAEHEIVSLPSASVLHVLRQGRADRSPARKTIAVMADPVFNADDPRLRRTPGNHDQDATTTDLERSIADFGLGRFERLPFSGEEAETILSLLPPDETFAAMGLAANRATATSGDLARYRTVHFATHGLLNARHPALSGIVLSMVDEAGQPLDGFLRAHEISDLELSADLVVLSACRTALGKQVRGEGILGLPRAFFDAGVPRAVVSLWNVSDRATAELMGRFYRGLFQGGLTASEALRTAQLSMRDEGQWQAPYYWAGFVLQGDWR